MLPPFQREAILDEAIRRNVARGATVELRQQFAVVLLFKRRVNHVVHAILSILTFGLWLFVWLLLAATGRDTRMTLNVDGYGRVFEVTNR